MQFVSSNCFSCHGRGQSKGGVSLAGINTDFSNPDNADLWNEVVAVVDDGSMPPQNRLSQQQRSQFVERVRQALDEAGALGTDYLADAKRSFGKGREKEALEYLYAHLVTCDDDEAKDLLGQARWFSYGKRPTTTLRFATGVVLDAPSTLTDVQPIGSGQGGGFGGGGYGGEGMGPGMGRGGANSRGGSGQRSFTSLTGDMGKAMVGAFESRWTAGDLGTIFSEVVYSAPGRSGGNNAFGGGNSSGRGFGGMGMGMGQGAGYGAGYGGDGGDYGGEGQGMGMGGPGYGGGYGGEGASGGRGGAGAGYGGEGYGGEASGGGGAALANVRENIMPGQTVTPGLIYLGVASQADLLARAKARGVDAVFVFDVKAAKNRFGQVNNDTRIRLVPLEGKPVGATKVLKNTEVERARARGTGEDEVQKNIDRLFKGFDDNFVLGTLPNLKPEHAKGRIRALLAKREAMPEDEEHCLASMGIYVFDTEPLFERLCRDAATDSSHDFGRDIIPGMIEDGSIVQAFPFRDPDRNATPYWRDVGTIDAYYRANMDLVSVDPQLNLYDADWPIRSYTSPSLPPPKFVFDGRDEPDRRGVALNSIVGAGTIISGGLVDHCLIGNDVRINSYSQVLDSILFDDVHIGRNARIRRTIIDKHVRVPADFEVGFDSQYDRDRGFHVTSSGVVVLSPTDNLIPTRSFHHDTRFAPEF